MLARLGSSAVPTISVFYGIVIAMYLNDPRAARLVKEWVELHRDELEEDWRLARQLRPLKSIEPLR